MNMFGSNTQKSNLFLVAVVSVTLFSCSSVESMRFELAHGKAARCFSEEINKNVMVVGNYSIVNPNEGHPLNPNHTITAQVYRVGGKGTLHLAEDVQSGQFSFTTYESDNYLICFMDTRDDPQQSLSIDFEWKTGVVYLDRHNIAKRSHIDRMAYDVQTMHEIVLSIKDEMRYLLERKEEEEVLNYITDNRIFLLIFVSVFIPLSMAGLQVWHLRSFFQKKKLIVFLFCFCYVIHL